MPVISPRSCAGLALSLDTERQRLNVCFRELGRAVEDPVLSRRRQAEVGQFQTFIIGRAETFKRLAASKTGRSPTSFPS